MGSGEHTEVSGELVYLSYVFEAILTSPLPCLFMLAFIDNIHRAAPSRSLDRAMEGMGMPL